ncbi:MAG: hypothetical protein DRQ55_05810 [Planctomycetota bacterium]|nr:MAG: hypothetical protein DRQ55_05810 [Planctomycetota bacterium]
MPTGPDPTHADDPRLPGLLAAALKQQGIAPELGESVRRLVLGSASPLEFVCCDSGCSPCNKDYMRAAERVLVGLADGPLQHRGGARSRPWWAFWRRG